jgi:alanine dehydrogenase
MKSGAHAVAYETVVGRDGSLPLLTPMSEVAGRMSAQVAASLLQKNAGGAGILLGGVPGTPPARVLVIGGGVSGAAAAEIALGMRASVTILDKSLPRLRDLDARFGGHVRTIASSTDALEREVAAADVVIGAVLIPGAAAPKLVSREMLGLMKRGSVLVDIAIDQGGCFETSRATTHADPVFVVDGIIHYCVANMPGSVPRTSSYALNNATLPYGLALAGGGVEAIRNSPALLAGLSTHQGKLTSQPVAEALGLAFTAPEAALAA